MKNHMKCIVTAIGLAVGVTAASGQSLNEDLKLRASDGTDRDLFGNSVAIDNGIVAVGAFMGRVGGLTTGAAYLFDAATGKELFKLRAQDRANNDRFGWGIAIEDDIVAVGAAFNDDHDSDSGSVHLFDATTGLQRFKLTASDAYGTQKFGYSIAIDNGIVAVGTAPSNGLNGFSGAAYLFDATTGEELFKLTPSDGAIHGRFGFSIAIDNGIVAVGSMYDDERAGSIYLFDVTTGKEIKKLIASDRMSYDHLGRSVAIDDGIVVAGASGADLDELRVGAAYIFDASTGMELFKLTAGDGLRDDAFGSSVAIQNGRVVVGEHMGDEAGVNSGAAYLFDAATGEQLAKLTPSDGISLERFGSTIGFDDGVIVVGENRLDGVERQLGSAYLFDIGCRVDMNNDFALNFYDVSAFFGLFVAGDLAVDFNGDGDLNFGDVSAFITEFGQGCPFVN